MEKMKATFYVLVVLGTLLEPMLAETFNTTDAFITATPELQTQNPADRNHSLDVSNATGVYDVNMTRSENSTISGTQMPPVEEMNMTTSTLQTTTDKMKDVRTTTKDTRPITKKYRTTTKHAPTDSHAETGGTSVYVIVLILVIVGVAVIGIIFFCVKSNRKRFSVDVHAKHEDAQIPLASVEPEMCDRSQGSKLKTVSSVEALPSDGLEKTEKQTAPTDGDQQLTESPAKSQTSESPAEKKSVPNIVDDADPTASTKTSVETLNDVLNENNSNNNPVWDVSVPFIQICLDD